MAQGVVIIGAQWGDEGKGKIVDHFAAQADSVARFQGGNNAGHTLVVNGKQTVLHLIPSGILQDHPKCLIGSGAVVDPEILLKEIEALTKMGKEKLHERIVVSERCHLILDYHKQLDAAREGRKGEGIGTTKRGIGPAYEDRASRRGLRICDLYQPQLFESKLRQNWEEKNFLLKEFYKVNTVSMDEFLSKYFEIAKKIRPYVGDVADTLHKAIQKGDKILYEGAQGVLLDLDYGTYPYVTSSHTLPSQAALGTGARLPKDTLFMGVIKAYATRVGSGPFPTELNDDIGNKLREKGMEFGATTGRPRRCGWLDLVAVKYALQVSGINHLTVTKADVLSGFEELKVCTAYKYQGKTLTHWPCDNHVLENVEPIYETLPGWKEDLSQAKRSCDFPTNLRDYIAFIENFTSSQVNLVSVGAGREAVIELAGTF